VSGEREPGSLATPQWRGRSTLAVHAGSPHGEPGEPVVTPIFQTSTFFNDREGGGELLYTRYGNNPNHRLLEARIAALEGAEDCVVTGSGMSAIVAALLSCATTGSRVVAAEALYGGTRVLLDRELPRLGIRTEYVDFGEPGWEVAITGDVQVVIMEVPANPLLRVPDLPAVAAAARAVGAALIVDSTFATPINFRPLAHGADLVVHSGTKYLGGHSDVTAGAVAGSEQRMAAVRDRVRILGPVLDPHAAWLVERGIKTLALRMERHNRNGLEVARWCAKQPRVRRVHYPGLPEHPDHDRARLLLDGFGGMLGIELAGGGEAAARFVGRLRLARVAPSLGGVETLVSEPRYTSHAAMSPEERERQGMPDGFVRISLGIEDADDIIADLEWAIGEE
jgi:cystathionine beta-lyase/cystathionine gamma-synthase